jgi:hypothetical protein
MWRSAEWHTSSKRFAGACYVYLQGRRFEHEVLPKCWYLSTQCHNIYYSCYNRYQQLHVKVKSVISNLQIIQKIWYNYDYVFPRIKGNHKWHLKDWGQLLRLSSVLLIKSDIECKATEGGAVSRPNQPQAWFNIRTPQSPNELLGSKTRHECCQTTGNHWNILSSTLYLYSLTQN